MRSKSGWCGEIAWVVLSLGSTGAIAQDIDLANCAAATPPYVFEAATGVALDRHIGILNSQGGNLYIAFETNPSGLTGTACTADTHAFVCNAVRIELPDDMDTPVPPAAQVRLYGTPDAADEFAFRIIATPAAGGSGCSKGYRLRITASPDTQAPSVPTGLTATLLANNSIRLAWNASTDNIKVTGYQAQWKTPNRNSAQPPFVTVTGPVVPAPTYDLNGHMPSTQYSFVVRAVDAAGNFSAFSNPTLLATPAGVAPMPPGNISVDPQ